MTVQPLLQTLTTLHNHRLNSEDINAGLLYISFDLNVHIYNDLAGRLLDMENAVGQDLHLRDCLDRECEEYQILASVATSNRELRDTVVTWEIGGRIRHVLMDTYQHRNEADQVIGMYVMMKDLGNFVALEQQMQRSDKLATVGKIAAGIAHEIRNPLTTIKGFLQMFESRFTAEHMPHELDYTKVMLDEIDRVNSLVSELLLLSKPHQVEMKPCSISALLKEIHPLIESQALLRGIDYECKLGLDANIVADKSMMKQVILNLAKNALEAMESGGDLRISVTTEGDFVSIDVSDTGPGISYYQIDRIFDAFYTTKEKGTGLGLPICQRIVTEHGGEIRVSSKGFGCTFSVLIPCCQNE